MAEHSPPAVIGVLPYELQGSFSLPLPISGYGEQVPYQAEWDFGVPLSAGDLHPHIRHMWPIIRLAANLGSLSLRPHTRLVARVRQAAPRDFFTAGLGWHQDRGVDDGVYRRVIISDVLGPLYEKDGRVAATPDYGMLLIDGASEHCAQDSLESVRRTRLQVTRISI